jgi:hypothetical protein
MARDAKEKENQKSVVYRKQEKSKGLRGECSVSASSSLVTCV